MSFVMGPGGLQDYVESEIQTVKENIINGKKNGKCIKRYNKGFHVMVLNLYKGDFDNV